MAKKKHYDIHKCPECGKDCLSALELKIHLKTHGNSDYDKKRSNSTRSVFKKERTWEDE